MILIVFLVLKLSILFPMGVFHLRCASSFECSLLPLYSIFEQLFSGFFFVRFYFRHSWKECFCGFFFREMKTDFYCRLLTVTVLSWAAADPVEAVDTGFKRKSGIFLWPGFIDFFQVLGSSRIFLAQKLETHDTR